MLGFSIGVLQWLESNFPQWVPERGIRDWPHFSIRTQREIFEAEEVENSEAWLDLFFSTGHRERNEV